MFYKIKSLEDFYAFIQCGGVGIIHFWAEWNASDITLTTILKELEDEFMGKARFCSLDVDQEHLFDFLRSLSIINVPTLAYFKDGNKIYLEIGLRKKEELREKITNLLNINQ